MNGLSCDKISVMILNIRLGKKLNIPTSTARNIF